MCLNIVIPTRKISAIFIVSLFFTIIIASVSHFPKVLERFFE